MGISNCGVTTGVGPVNRDRSMVKKFAQLDEMDYWVDVSCGPRCKRTGSVLRPQQFDFQYALHTNCMDCANWKQCIRKLSDVEVEMVNVMRKEKNCENQPALTETTLRVPGLEIIEKKKRVMKKTVREMDRKMLDLEVEEQSVWGSVDSIE